MSSNTLRTSVIKKHYESEKPQNGISVTHITEKNTLSIIYIYIIVPTNQ